MTRTASLRAQYRAADSMIEEIFSAIDDYEGDGDAYPLSMRLARLAGILRTNFAMEEQALYPRMLTADHREAAIIARVFQSELGHLSARFDRFMERWGSSAAIAASPAQLEFEAGMMFAAIRDRVQRANRELYPVADVVSTLGELRSQVAAGQDPVDYPREPKAAAASPTSSAMISATGSSRLTMPTD